MDDTRHREVLSGVWERRMTNHASEISVGEISVRMSVRAGVHVSSVSCHVQPVPLLPI